MTQSPRKPRPAGDEGEAYTAAVMRRVHGLRRSRDWTAQRLAQEMSRVGVPWTRDTVVNLENGRRKRLAVHELLALARLLDIAPVHLMAGFDEDVPLPVTPDTELSAREARDWIRGIAAPADSDMAKFRANVPASEADSCFVMVDNIRDEESVRTAMQGLEIFMSLAGMPALSPFPKQVIIDGRKRQVAPGPSRTR